MFGADGAIGLIFGGCCSNVFTLESIVKHEPDSGEVTRDDHAARQLTKVTGLLITVFQFLVASLFVFPSQLEPTKSSWTIRRPRLPMRDLFSISFMFFAINMLNNWAFAFNISVPMHIILRSFGSVTTLTLGWLWGKQYSSIQVLSVVTLTVGVVISAWADAQAKGRSMDLLGGSAFGNGLLVLFTAQLISAYMGIYVEQTYSKHGRHWTEVLYYTHAFGLLFSLTLYPTLAYQLGKLWGSPPFQLTTWLRTAVPWLQTPVYMETWSPPVGIAALALNAATQVVCISGVNKLSAQTSAVAVTIVLNVRKLVSFLLSCWIFGNPISGLMAVGAAVVFGSGALYGWDSSRARSRVEAGKRSVEAVNGKEKKDM